MPIIRGAARRKQPSATDSSESAGHLGNFSRDVATGAMICRRFRLPRENIGYVRFIVEAYDGLAQVSADAGEDEIQWLIPASQIDEANRVIASLRDEAQMFEVAATR